MLSGERIEYRRLRAPREDGATLVDPPWPEAAGLLAQNRSQQQDYSSSDVSGRSLAELASLTRQEALAAAIRYCRSYCDLEPPINLGSRPILASGHQPELFHPGVWLKNFALGRLADELNGVALNLVIDTDEVGPTAIRVPTGSVETPLVEAIALDASAGRLPFELVPIQDQKLFRSFGKRAAEAIRPLVDAPLVEEFWPLAIERAAAGTDLGQAIAQARHRQEIGWGTTNLELPQSMACQLTGYRWLIAHILVELPRFHSAHNEALAEYRQVHGIRNLAQPVPALRTNDGWFESPFWIYCDDNPQRRPLLARRCAEHWQLADGNGWETQVAWQSNNDPQSNVNQLVEQLEQLERLGVHIRTRALATTMFARLLLCDLFVHGIGGAKYDQLTDAIIHRYFAVAAPKYLTVTGTLKLPISRNRPTPGRRREITQRLREIRFHPEAVLREEPATASDPAIQRQIADKEAWIRNFHTQAHSENGTKRHAVLVELNRQLASHLTDLQQSLRLEQQELDGLVRRETILGSREYSFCLYPEQDLRRLTLALPVASP